MSPGSCSDSAIAKLATSKGILATQLALSRALNSPDIGQGDGPANRQSVMLVSS